MSNEKNMLVDKGESLNFVLCWHMHQPWYQEGIDGDYKLPWVYLHAIKDYEDMVMHLEAHPKMHVVVNFAPVLLEQLDDYAIQLKNWLDSAQPMKDPMLNLIAGSTPFQSLRMSVTNCCVTASVPMRKK